MLRDTDSLAAPLNARQRSERPAPARTAGEADALQLTPRATPGLPQILGEFGTLADGLDYAARGLTGYNFYSPRGKLEHVLPFATLRERAQATGRRLVRAGLARGERVAIVAETGPDFMAAFFGCQYAGLVPCPLPYTMNIGGREAYVERIAGMLKSADAAMALAPTDLLGHLGEAAARAGTRLVMSHEELAAIEAGNVALAPFGPGDVAYIQYSSGSTSNPKGVLVTQAAICANVRGILQHGLKLTPEDRAFSWLPLYHDMGLVGFCLAPMMGQVTVDYLATTAFARRPALWLRLMSDNRSTIAYSPSFGYDLAARRVNGHAAELDLSAWRVAGIGGDMVRPDVLETFAAKMAVAGFDATAFLPSYGMAEATLAITFGELDRPIRVDRVDSARYKLSRRAVPVGEGAAAASSSRVRAFVSCGRPMPGHEIEVRDETGRSLGERQIGHVWMRGPSLMAGYFRNEEATREAMDDDGWMNTGDMGYWLDGEIVVTGRSKDLILHNGRNIWPQDIEWAVERVEPLRGGDAAAFSVETREGGEEVVLLVQCRLTDMEEQEDLRRRVAAVVSQTAGVECEVVLVPPRSLPFTSSGKLSRAGARKGYLSGEIAEISKGYLARKLQQAAGPVRMAAGE